MSEVEKTLQNFDLVGGKTSLDYEKMINDSENEIKKLIEFCDIGWDENCISFYKNKKTVSTASLAQVRSPIYKTSLKKWKNYSKNLSILQKLLN